MNIGVPLEHTPRETRVALVPESVARLIKAGATVTMERGAGIRAGFPDALYENAGASLADAATVFKADLVCKVQKPTVAEVAHMARGSHLLSLLQPSTSAESIAALDAQGVTAFALELVPRITRAQSMDVLSSQATVSGYKAVLVGASAMVKFMPMLTTAAGTIRPSQALIMGAGVAGLQAIATARRLGAVVEAFDVRAATKEQVESLGAKFVDTGVTADGTGGYARELSAEERQKQQTVVNDRVAKADLVITTAAVPGRPAPRLIDRATVERMRPGAVIVDLGAESGGNCELTRAGETVVHRGVTIIGPVNLAATVPRHASEMYARNLFNFLSPALNKEGDLAIDWNDEVFAGAVLTHAGTIRHEPTRKAFT